MSAETAQGFPVGSLVRARGREWVVLPGSEADFLLLRPLGGTLGEETGISTELEDIRPASFEHPDPSDVGDDRSCRLLRDAVRLSTRAGSGPLRSLSRIAVDPRPYQLVPLLLALKQETVRLLIADDVGVGKTVEACLIARELYDRGEIQRIGVLCPPHLATQWQAEMKDMFHLEAELVLSSTAARLERGCALGQSLFEVHPLVIVSKDFIKSERRREEFVRSAPELLIVDEAHTCAFGFERGSRHQSHELVKRLAAQRDRHLVLVTATPHSGNEQAFRSLLGFLDPSFAELPEDLSGAHNEPHRKRLARHFVQRRRGDLRHYLQSETPFPDREDKEESYALSASYRELFARVLAYARETVQDDGGDRRRQRIRWWSALALLRSLASSPAAAIATLQVRSGTAEGTTTEEIDTIGQSTILDLALEEESDESDFAPGADFAVTEETSSSEPTATDQAPVGRRGRLLEFAREAATLVGDKDTKLQSGLSIVRGLIRDGYNPIIFCRFIPTALYVAEQFSKKLGPDVTVGCVTGLLSPDERATKVSELAEAEKRVLVCTDCLSEGINLQEQFDAVVHYDLSWNPTRHEQREGRVDRFKQIKPKVRVVTLFGRDNGIDGIVLDVLIRKHKAIRHSLGISIPMPIDTSSVLDAIFEGLLLREQGGPNQLLLPSLEEYLRPKKEELDAKWENVAAREQRSRTLFAHHGIPIEEVREILAEARAAVGSSEIVRSFTEDALVALGAVSEHRADRLRFDLTNLSRSIRELLELDVQAPGRRRNNQLDVRFEPPALEGVRLLSRTHPLVERLATWAVEIALDPKARGGHERFLAKRAGAVRTTSVTVRTTLLLVRFRFDLTTRQATGESTQIAEEIRLLAFEGAPSEARWLPEESTSMLLEARPAGDITPEQKTTFVQRVVEGIPHLLPRLEKEAQARAAALLDAHQRVREAARTRGIQYTVEPQLPPDLLGVYVFLPAAPEGTA